ncbi:HET-domain-containing protein [Clathrospora elynae]|uniref:HET-domain-containing protein n=1 Tax=Clathrospora elynae TaxID=706981 RepID=A0A6A5T5D4_9PLEO|nr:HET-domain-containing protein [Clathrospora elynae]
MASSRSDIFKFAGSDASRSNSTITKTPQDDECQILAQFKKALAYCRRYTKLTWPKARRDSFDNIGLQPITLTTSRVSRAQEVKKRPSIFRTKGADEYSTFGHHLSPCFTYTETSESDPFITSPLWLKAEFLTTEEASRRCPHLGFRGSLSWRRLAQPLAKRTKSCSQAFRRGISKISTSMYSERGTASDIPHILVQIRIGAPRLFILLSQLRSRVTQHSVMRLINTRTIELQWFNNNEIPKYAILSHTWGPNEVSNQELVWINRARALSSSPLSSSALFTGQDGQTAIMLAAMEMMIRGNTGTSVGSIREEDLMKRIGYSKIIHAAEQARGQGCDYIWVDTCCIDKSSSAELQEAINSMYRWYRDAEVCIVYLGDVAKPSSSYTTASEIARTAFQNCRWVRRGWTLQELVAPAVCRFYYEDWTLIGEKVEFLQELADITGIPVHVLEEEGAVKEISVAERMSWASHRDSTRVEDVAYSLLGIFDIHMPLLYGEGEKAFIRLQEEILKTTDDHSLFAWCATTSSPAVYRGLLARTPLEFQHCRSIERENVTSTFPIGSTSIGLRIQLEFLPDPQDKSCMLAMIRSSNSMNQRLAIRLACLDGAMQYARVDAGSLILIDDWPTGQLKTIYVRQKLSIPPAFTTAEFSCFHIRRRVSRDIIPPVRIISVSPHNAWDKAAYELRIPDGVTVYWGALLLHVQAPTYVHALCVVAFGFNRSTCHYWIKAVPDFVPSQDGITRGTWPQAVKTRIPDEVYDLLRGGDVRQDMFVVGDSGLGINVSIEAGLCGDSIALQVQVDGLVKWQ